MVKGGIDRRRSGSVRLVDVGGHARAGDAEAGGHAGSRARYPDVAGYHGALMFKGALTAPGKTGKKR